jgi:uncharacterized protein YfaS (alpha-2-macroglobulin family)
MFTHRHCLLTCYVVMLLALLNVANAAPRRGDTAFRVVAGEPRGELSSDQLRKLLEVMVQFSTDVVRPGDVGSSVPLALMIEPPVEGRAAWRDTRTFVVTIDPRQLQAGAEYRCRVPATLRDVRGRALADNSEREFSFRTPWLAVLGARQTAAATAGEFAVQLEFSYPVNHDEVARHVTVSSGGSELSVSRAYTPGGDANQGVRGSGAAPTRTPVIEFRGPVVGDMVTVTVDAGLRPAHGGRPLDSGARFNVKVRSVMEPVEARGYWKAEQAFVRIEFTAPVALEHAAENITIDPPVAFSVDREWGVWVRSRGPNALVLSGGFQPATRYTITLGPGLQSQEGQPLRERRTMQVWMPKVSPFLRFENVGGHLSPNGTMKARVRSSGIAQFTVQVWRLYDNNITYYVTSDDERRVVEQYGSLLTERKVAAAGVDSPATTVLDLREAIAAGGPLGVFLLKVRADYPPDAPGAGDHDELEQRYSGLGDEAVIVLSNLGVVGKYSADESVVWVTALDTAKPVEGASVEWYSRTNQLVDKSTTDKDGIARTMPDPFKSRARAVIVVVRQGRDVTYLDLRGSRLWLPGEQTLADARPFRGHGYEAFATADRGVYRPGEGVHIAGFVRDAAWQPPRSPMPVEMIAVRADGVKTQPQRITLTPSGAFETSLTLERDAPLGLWRGLIRLPGAEERAKRVARWSEGEIDDPGRLGELGSVEFYVEEFMPVRLEVNVDMAERRFSTSEPLVMDIRARELFGLPAALRPFSVSAVFTAEPFTCSTWADYVFGDSSVAIDRTHGELEGQMLDGQGQAHVRMPVGVTRAPAAVRAQIGVTVRDPGGRTVTRNLTRIIDPVPFYIGARLGTSGFAQLGKPLQCRVVTVRPDCTPAADVAELSATIHRVVWDSILTRSGDGYSFSTSERLIPQTTMTVALSAGAGELEWTPAVEGQYAIVLTGAGGAQTRVMFYASSGQWSADQPWSLEKPGELELVPDKPAYQVGEIARILVKAPFAGTMLVSCEQNRTDTTKVQAVDSNTAEIQLPVYRSMVPNVFVTATLVRPVRPSDKWLPHRAFGTVSLTVQPQEQPLAVTVSAPPEVRPGSRFEAQVALADSTTSAPVEGDVVVWAVDEGVLALTDFATPDPWRFFYAPRRLGVATADFYADLMPDLVAQAPSAPGGGEGEVGRRLSPVTAERVRTVVLWRGLVRTDAQGQARVGFDVPAYAGRVRVMAAAAAGARFGAGEAPVTVRGPVVVREHFPRFLSPTDEARVPVVVYNNTDATTTARVRVWAQGPVVLAGVEGLRAEEGAAGGATTFSGQVVVAAGSSRTLGVALHAGGGIGVAKLGVAASVGDFTHEESIELAVRPAATVEHVAGHGVVEAGQSVRLALPQNFLAGATTGTLIVGGTRRGELLQALHYNRNYPYGCAEQVISAAFPLLAMSDLAETYEAEGLTSQGVAQAIAAACERVAELQTAGGGLAMWPDQREAWLWASLYGAHFWLEARRAGIAVAQDNLDALLDYIRAEAFRAAGTRVRPDADEARERAYAAYVLALAGRPARDQMELLYDKREELPLGASALLAAAYWRVGLPEAARQLLAIGPDEAGGRETGRTLASPDREAAILLATLVDVDPEGARTRALAERLYSRIQPSGHWGTTQDNAFAVWALARFEKSRKGTQGGAGLVRVGGLEKTCAPDQPVVVSLADLTQPVEVVGQGPGPVHYSWHVEGVPLAATDGGETQGIELKRRFVDAQMAEVRPEDLRQGRAVFVELTVKADRRLHNVVLVDLLPACLEIENPHLATSEHFEEMLSGDLGAVQRVEARDDRMVIFCSLEAPNEPCVLRYPCRVVSAGRFVQGPASGECMYDPEVRARTQSGEVRVRPMNQP